jgi:polyhydroxyalkanoate synthesis repressor PhaR
MAKKQDKPTVVKKYANRRLYDTGRSSYVTLDDLCIMVKEGHDFVVYDAKTGEDLTHQVLTQIIVDQEAKGENLLPIPFLRQLIGYYGDNLQGLVPDYLQQSFDAFTKNHEQFSRSLINPVGALEEMGRKNMEMFENAMRAWTGGVPGGPGVNAEGAANAEQKIRDLKKTIAEMEKEIERLKKA